MILLKLFGWANFFAKKIEKLSQQQLLILAAVVSILFTVVLYIYLSNAADKGDAQSSLADGRFFCVENNRFGHEDFLREIGMYCVDAHGHPVDMYNHAMDEFRYAHNYFYKNYVL